MNQEELNRYTRWVEDARIRPECSERVAGAVNRALRNMPRLRPVADILRVPWTLLAALQELEASGRMDRHPANGDSLQRRTVNVPAGLPRRGEPPYTYESVAGEELAEIQRPPSGVWTLQEMCHAAEHFNGLGYRNKGKPSPYVVAATTLEEAGRYVADGVYDAKARSNQVGALALWIGLRESGEEVP